MPFYRINAGPMAVDNGAKAPLTTLFHLANVTDQKVITGEYWGQDYLRVPENEDDKAALESLLNETKLVWELVEDIPHNLKWQL